MTALWLLLAIGLCAIGMILSSLERLSSVVTRIVSLSICSLLAFWALDQHYGASQALFTLLGILSVAGTLLVMLRPFITAKKK